MRGAARGAAAAEAEDERFDDECEREGLLDFEPPLDFELPLLARPLVEPTSEGAFFLALDLCWLRCWSALFPIFSCRFYAALDDSESC